MAHKIGKAEIERLRRRAESANSRLRNVKEKAEKATDAIVSALAINASSFAFGLVNGRWMDEDGERGVKIFGVPLELASGITLHLIGFAAGDMYANRLHDFGNGALAAYTTTMGVMIGDKMRMKSGGGGAPPPQQMPASTSGAAGLSDAALWQMAQGRAF